MRPIDVMSMVLLTTMSLFAQATDRLPTISPGLWQIMVQLQGGGAAMPVVKVNQCLTAADADDPSKLLGRVANPGASGCTYSDKSYSENTFHFAMECGGAFAIKASGQVSFTPNTLSGTMDTSATINGHSVELKNWIVAQRIGGC